jgi:hypothetical protein
LVTGDKPPAPNTALSTAALAIKLALGIVLILMAVRQWRRMGRPASHPPGGEAGPALPVGRRRLAAFLQPWALLAGGAATVAEGHRSGCLCPHRVLAGDHSVRVLAGQAESTKADLQRAQDWLMSHARQLMAVVALFADAYIVISGLERLLTQPDRCRLGSPSAACAAFPVHSVRLSA